MMNNGVKAQQQLSQAGVLKVCNWVKLPEQTDIIGCFNGEKVYYKIHWGGFPILVLRVDNEWA